MDALLVGIYYGVVNVVPVPTLFVESVDFVSNSPGFETDVVQVIRTTRLDSESKGKCLVWSRVLH